MPYIGDCEFGKLILKQIWGEFEVKLQNDSFNLDDFNDELRPNLMYLLCGENRKEFRDRILNANVRFSMGEQRYIVSFDHDGDSYRLDFVGNADNWKLLFIECITIPIAKIEMLPFDDFPPLKEIDENWIREERRISTMINWYNFIKNTSGIEKALEHFRIGAGEVLAAKAWVPYFSDKKAFIVYISWYESRVIGEKVTIEKFSDDECIVKYTDPIWFKMYNVATHLRLQIPFDEYKQLYEYIWHDRAKCSGWKIEINHENNITILKFYDCGYPIKK